MNILLTNPFSWPYVRRGSERFLHELSCYLASRGHDVTVLTSTPGSQEEVSRENRLLTVRKPQIASLAAKLMRLAPEKSFPIRCLPFMLRNSFDITHCLYFYDGCAAGVASLFSRKPYVLHITGIPLKRFFRRRPWDYAALKFSLSQAAEVVVPSQLALEYLETEFGYHATLLPPPCDLECFPLATSRDLDRPRIVCLGAFGERRKGARVMLAAFHLLKKHVPNAVLQYSGDMPASVRKELQAVSCQEVFKDVEFLGRGDVGDLPALYARAAVTVLPSLLDVFGMVLVESLATGTPIVATRHGALPEIFAPEVGALFDPGSTNVEATNSTGLCEAILETLRLYSDPQLPYRCRRRAEAFGWDSLGPKYEEMYRRLVG
jgi:phosphatidylinositol alpha-mannosyltransferase